MNAQTTKNLVIDGITSYSTEMLVIVGAVVGIIVGFFVLRKGFDYMRPLWDERAEWGDVPNRSKGEKWGIKDV